MENQTEEMVERGDNQKITYRELVDNISKAGLKIKEFAELLNMKPNSITNLKRKGATIPKLLFIVSLLARRVNELGGNVRGDLMKFEFEKVKPKRKIGEKGLFKRKGE